jgi:hypothetical protein
MCGDHHIEFTNGANNNSARVITGMQTICGGISPSFASITGDRPLIKDQVFPTSMEHPPDYAAHRRPLKPGYLRRLSEFRLKAILRFLRDRNDDRVTLYEAIKIQQ